MNFEILYIELKRDMEKKANKKATLKFLVIDNGIGISKANQQKIFEDFEV